MLVALLIDIKRSINDLGLRPIMRPTSNFPLRRSSVLVLFVALLAYLHHFVVVRKYHVETDEAALVTGADASTTPTLLISARLLC